MEAAPPLGALGARMGLERVLVGRVVEVRVRSSCANRLGACGVANAGKPR
jgi:hypothetical protein